ncbi:MAG: DUF3365 domain-containing protein [Deltaproteobacteria bacterium]|nr:DUF3365 domain-containing protein [Deltaproteobacteria bacterium]
MRSKDRGNFSSVFIVSMAAGLIWTVVLSCFFVWGIKNIFKHTKELATYQARAFFQEIVTTRSWNATHGSVYVLVTDKTQPNPYLDDPNRDVITTNGLALTKINPAYMTRQIAEIASKKNLVWFHITSSKPIRPENAPDEWESDTLEYFSEGLHEYAEFKETDNAAKVFRYMAPLWVDRECLKCHAKQGYKEKDLRGGISVTIKAGTFLGLQNRQIRNLSLAYIIIWVLGLLGIRLAYNRLIKEEKLREDYIFQLKRERKKREKVIFHLNKSTTKVKRLRKLLPICFSCNKIRNDKGYWENVESYIKDHSEADFRHGICPECVEKLYPDQDIKN